MSDLTVYYDASCPLCRREIALYEGRARASFVDVSDPRNVPADLSPGDAMARFHVRQGDRLLSGASAFAALWRVTPGISWLGRVAALPGVRHALELGYRGFLRVRPWLQRRAGGTRPNANGLGADGTGGTGPSQTQCRAQGGPCR